MPRLPWPPRRRADADRARGRAARARRAPRPRGPAVPRGRPHASRASVVAGAAAAPPAEKAAVRSRDEPSPLPPNPTAAASGVSNTVAPGSIVKQAALSLDSARSFLGTEPLVVPELPIRGVYRAQMIGYSQVVV